MNKHKTSFPKMPLWFMINWIVFVSILTIISLSVLVVARSKLDIGTNLIIMLLVFLLGIKLLERDNGASYLKDLWDFVLGKKREAWSSYLCCIPAISMYSYFIILIKTGNSYLLLMKLAHIFIALTLSLVAYKFIIVSLEKYRYKNKGY